MSRCAKVLDWALGTLTGVCGADPGGALEPQSSGKRKQTQITSDPCHAETLACNILVYLHLIFFCFPSCCHYKKFLMP